MTHLRMGETLFEVLQSELMHSENGFYSPVWNSIWIVKNFFRCRGSSVGIVTILLARRSADFLPAGARRVLSSPCTLSWCVRLVLYLYHCVGAGRCSGHPVYNVIALFTVA